MRASLGIPQLFKNFHQPLNPRATFLHLHQYTNALKSGRQRRQDDSWLEDVVFAISLISAWYNPTRRWSLFILAFPNGFGRPRLAFRQISTPFLTIPLFFLLTVPGAPGFFLAPAYIDAQGQTRYQTIYIGVLQNLWSHRLRVAWRTARRT